MAGVLMRRAHFPPVSVHDVTSCNQVVKNLAVFQCASRRRKSFNVSHPIMTADYQHITESKLPTYHFQNSLPRLPLPKLTDTTERYLRALQPILEPLEFHKTQELVKKFLDCEGYTCQGSLEAEVKDNRDTNWISRHWFDMYLTDRKPLPINYNPCLVFKDAEGTYMRQAVRASNMVLSSLRFYRSLNEELLEPEVYHMNPAKTNTPFFKNFTRMLPSSISCYGAYLFKAYPLDMSQYKNLFNTTRVPHIGKDEIKHTPGKRHIVVLRGGHFYIFDVLDENGDIIAPDLMLNAMNKILEMEEYPADFPVGVLTTEDRNVWAVAREHLVNTGNQEVLEQIDSALFLLALDDEKTGNDPVDIVRTFLHSDGANRWFDKSFSLILTADGLAGLNFEHSWGDGVAVLRYFNDIHEDSINKPRVHWNTLVKCDHPVHKLTFNLDDRSKASIIQAKHNFNKMCRALQVRALDYRRFGRNLCKPLNISPDAMMQLAFQLAYEQLEGKQVATYESCSTAAFKHGRTETVRPCTLETKLVCKALAQASPPTKTELQQMVIACSKYHSKLIKEAAMGQGFDRHLYALHLKSKEYKMDLELFNDPSYELINHNILSTSTLASENLQAGAFGPVVPDGLGIAYTLWPEHLGCIVTGYAGTTSKSGSFVRALQDCLDKIDKILAN